MLRVTSCIVSSSLRNRPSHVHRTPFVPVHSVVTPPLARPIGVAESPDVLQRLHAADFRLLAVTENKILDLMSWSLLLIRQREKGVGPHVAMNYFDRSTDKQMDENAVFTG